jgi:hypothetical protein
LIVEGVSGTMRDLPNFDSHTVNIAASRSRSPTLRRKTSPIRIPVAHSNPTIVSTVAAQSGGSNVRAAAISMAMSLSE